MVSIYISIDEQNRVQSYGVAEYGPITENPNDSHLIELSEKDEFLQGNIFQYRLIGGKLVKDEDILITNMKQSKKKELSKVCQEKILNGFDFVCKGNDYHFSYDYESQTNFQETYHLFQNSVIESVKWSAKLDGESVRIDLNKKDFEAVFFASVRHKQAHISKFKDQIEPLIEAQSTTEGLEAISWNGLVTNPENPGVVFKTDDTLDKQVDTLDSVTKTLNQKTELSDMAIMEIAMMVSMMMGGPM